MVAQCTGPAVVLRRDDVDTDQIVAAEYCKRITRSGYADVLFSRWRTDPAFPLNQPGAERAAVLIAGHNFGTGSSREHAVWALRDWGFGAVVASSFGDIFRRNAVKNGLIPVQLDPGSVAELAAAAAAAGTAVTVDLAGLVVRAGALSYRFALDGRSHRLLLDDLDEIAITLADGAAIAAYERSRFDWLARPHRGVGEHMTKPRTGVSVFDYMQGYTLCTVFAALESIGVLTGLAAAGLRPDQCGSNTFLTEATFRYLTERDVVQLEDDRYQLTEFGRSIYADRGYLVWLSGGYGHAMNVFGDLLTGKREFGADVDRDVRWVAVGSALIGQKDLWPHVVELARQFTFKRIADLGCGNAHYLISLCQAVGAAGIGVDISPAACKEAEQEVAKAGLGDRIAIIEADAGDLKKVPGIDAVDLVFTFFFLHEIYEHGFDVLVAYLRQIQESLPSGAHMLTAEVAPPGGEADGVELFTPEYALTQALMEQRLLDEGGWKRAFTEAGFEVVRVARPDLPEARIILARKP